MYASIYPWRHTKVQIIWVPRMRRRPAAIATPYATVGCSRMISSSSMVSTKKIQNKIYEVKHGIQGMAIVQDNILLFQSIQHLKSKIVLNSTNDMKKWKKFILENICWNTFCFLEECIFIHLIMCPKLR